MSESSQGIIEHVKFNPHDAEDVKQTSTFLTKERGLLIGKNKFRNLASLMDTIQNNPDKVLSLSIEIKTNPNED